MRQPADNDTAVQQYYGRGLERDRLGEGFGLIEFARTCEIVARELPASPAIVADIGGGPGRYTDWLVDAGHRVVHRDIVSDHVEQVRARHRYRVDTAVGDGRSLDLADDSADAMLVLGPMYHLPNPGDRAAVLAEAARVVRPGGPVWIAIITRWSGHLHAALVERQHQTYPDFETWLGEVETSGIARQMFEGSFNGFFHTPALLRSEVEASPLAFDSIVAVEGPAMVIPDLSLWLDDPTEREVLWRLLRRLESVPDLFAASPHLLAVARAV